MYDWGTLYGFDGYEEKVLWLSRIIDQCLEIGLPVRISA